MPTASYAPPSLPLALVPPKPHLPLALPPVDPELPVAPEQSPAQPLNQTVALADRAVPPHLREFTTTPRRRANDDAPQDRQKQVGP